MPPTGNGRILVVDDERFFRELFRDVLEAAGHHVGTAASGDDALKELGEARFDVLLTDVVMPGLDGIALVRESRKLDPDLEAVAVTGHDDVRLAVQAMNAGCADFLTKPVDRNELVEVCGRAMARARIRREHSRLLVEGVELARSQLYRDGLQILATRDVERLQHVVLSVLARVTHAQGVALWMSDDAGQLVLRGHRGISDGSALVGRIDPQDDDWAPRLAHPAPSVAPGSSDAGEAFIVPLLAEDEPLGLALLWDPAHGAFAGEQHAAAATVAEFAAVAFGNARRFQALERVGLLDRDTGAYNLAYFIDYAGKEFYKARRYGRAFSLVILSVDNVEQMRQEGGREPYRRATRGLVAAITRVARDADILAKVSDAEFYVLLPETDHFGALMFLRRAAEEVRNEAAIVEIERRCPVLLSMGAAAFPIDGEDFDELLQAARARVQEQRGSLLRRLHLGDLPANAFWELADLLLSDSGRIPDSSPSARLRAGRHLFSAAQREVGREIARDPRARGLLYVGTQDRLPSAPVLEELPPAEIAARDQDEDAMVRVYLLGQRGARPTAIGHPLVTEVYLDGDPRIAAHEFLLFLSEHSAYGLLTGPDERVFHTSDAPLVDALVSKLQAYYDLQPL